MSDHTAVALEVGAAVATVYLASFVFVYLGVCFLLKDTGDGC